MLLHCPHCACEFEAEDSELGKLVECPSCRNFLHAVIEGRKICPGCKRPVKDGASICIDCGYNLATGDRLSTEYTNPEDLLPLPMKILRYICDVFPGFFRPLVLIAFIITIGAALTAFFVGLMLIGMGVMMTGIFVCAAGGMIYAQGLCFLFAGSISYYKQALADFTSTQDYWFWTLLLSPFLTVFIIMVYVGKQVNG